MKIGNSRSAIILVDNMRIGGYQRLALDQAYFLSQTGLKVTMYVLSEPDKWIFTKIEESLIQQHGIVVRRLPFERSKLLLFFYRDTEIDSSYLIISHSLRATFSLRVLKFLTNRNFSVSTTVHQLPGLTDAKQRVKRFLYCQMTDRLYCFSKSVYFGWNDQFGRPFQFFLRNFGKKIELLRNGVFLGRLPEPLDEEEHIKSARIVFLGRPTFWKGLQTISNLADNRILADFDFLFMVPDEHNFELENLLEKLGKRAEVIRGKSIRSYEPRRGDVHIYPADYGPRVKVVEGISINCLEMGAIGVPSLITAGGISTWPELRNSILYSEIDWSDINLVAATILKLSNLRIENDEVDAVRNIVNIKNQFT